MNASDRDEVFLAEMGIAPAVAPAPPAAARPQAGEPEPERAGQSPAAAVESAPAASPAAGQPRLCAAAAARPGLGRDSAHLGAGANRLGAARTRPA